MSTPTTPPPAPATAPQTNVLAIVALIAAFVIAPLGIILGIIAQNQIKTTGEGGAGLAKAGIIIGAIFTVLGLIGIILSFVIPLLILGSVGYTY